MKGMRRNREDSWVYAQTRTATITRAVVWCTAGFAVGLPLLFLFDLRLAHLSVFESLGIVIVTFAIITAQVVWAMRKALSRYHD
jgi:hypothetical protein